MSLLSTAPGTQAAVPFPARLALVLASLAWVLPFQSPNFMEPITSFYGEATAILLGLAAFTCLRLTTLSARLDIPRASLLFLGFAALIILDVPIGRSAYPQQNLLAVLYLLWATIFAAVAWRLREVFGTERLLVVLSWFMVSGTLLSAGIGLAQVLGVPTPLSPFMLPRMHGRIFANTGQPNHLADYLCLGVASVAYLQAVGRIRTPAALAIAAPLVLVLAISGSRSAWLYLIALIGLAVVLGRVAPSPAASRLRAFSFAALAGFVLAVLAISLADGIQQGQVQTLVSRLHQQGVHSPERLRSWHIAWLMFLDAPLLGEGFRQFAWHHFILNAQLPPPRIEELVVDNAHNLLLHTLSEFGLAGLAVLLAGAASWIVALRRQPPGPETWWIASITAVLGIHSMLEYPLWYAYFLGIAAFVIGMSETSAVTVGKRGGAAMMLIPIMVLGWVAAANIFADYRTIQSLRDGHAGSGDASPPDARETVKVLLELQRHSVFTPFVEVGLARVMELDRNQIQDKLALNNAVMRFTPAGDVVYRHAILLALASHAGEAARQWDLALANYPRKRDWAVQMLMAPELNGDAGIELLRAHAQRDGEGKGSK
jgi:O-antigen ligase